MTEWLKKTSLILFGIILTTCETLPKKMRVWAHMPLNEFIGFVSYEKHFHILTGLGPASSLASSLWHGPWAHALLCPYTPLNCMSCTLWTLCLPIYCFSCMEFFIPLAHSCSLSLIHSFNKYLLSTYYGAGTKDKLLPSWNLHLMMANSYSPLCGSIQVSPLALGFFPKCPLHINFPQPPDSNPHWLVTILLCPHTILCMQILICLAYSCRPWSLEYREKHIIIINSCAPSA